MTPISLSLLALLSFPSGSRAPDLSHEVDAILADAYALYVQLHQHPELSSQETRTASTLAARLRSLGYDVTEHVGGTGIVAVLKNGAGPTIMLRTELDALPVEEKTGLPYASTVRAEDPSGAEVPVMHACGHDLHMAALVGTAAVLASSKGTWQGTLVLIGQPAEETITGARKMLDDGLLTRFPRPDAGVALHVSNAQPAGFVGVGSGYLYASADSLRITVFGKGGHGSAPETTVDPVVIAARIVLALQTIVSREVKPGEAAVVTVGYLHAGLKNNIIPDKAELGLTVRTYKTAVRRQVLAAISRIAKAEAEAAGAPLPPKVENNESTDALYDAPVLAHRLTGVLQSALGTDHVVDAEPVMGSEDYSCFVEAGVPSFYFALGGADPTAYEQARASGNLLPSNHSPFFAPDAEPALRTAILAEVAVLRDLLTGTAEELRASLKEDPVSN